MNDKEKTAKKLDAAITRVKSRETVLKQQLRVLKRQLDEIAKADAKFKELKDLHEANRPRVTAIYDEIKKVKAELIKELGLG